LNEKRDASASCFRFSACPRYGSIPKAPAKGDPLQRAIIEILHPIGCALATYASAHVQARLGGTGGDD